MLQAPFGNGWHDSLQYHAFCGERAFAARVFWTESMWHHSAWIYDGEMREVFCSAEPLRQSDDEFACLEGTSFRLLARDAAVTIDIEPGAACDALQMRFAPRQTFEWPSPIGPVLHQPNLAASAHHGGEIFTGVGYCKRYDFRERVGHWGYRFVHGAVDDGRRVIWTADATFGHNKYAYFKHVDADGRLSEAASADSVHRDDKIYAVVNAVRYELVLEESGVWETRLRSQRMDSQMRQRLCQMTVHRDGRSESGYAINETCFGTLG